MHPNAAIVAMQNAMRTGATNPYNQRIITLMNSLRLDEGKRK